MTGVQTCALPIFTIALSRNYRVRLGDISTAFLHTLLPEGQRIIVEAPSEYYPEGTYWELLRPLYGLKTAPRCWQGHFATVMKNLGGIRMKSDPNLYYFPETDNYVLVYVDDLMIVGATPDELFEKIAQQLLLRPTGELKEGSTQNFLGRKLRHTGQSIQLLTADGYIEEMLEEN